MFFFGLGFSLFNPAIGHTQRSHSVGQQTIMAGPLSKLDSQYWLDFFLPRALAGFLALDHRPADFSSALFRIPANLPAARDLANRMAPGLPLGPMFRTINIS